MSIMSLSQSQLSSVAEWFAGGASLDEIQKRIASEFGVHMTYLDLRLLVADLPQPEEKEETSVTGGSPVPEAGSDDSAAMPEDEADPSRTGGSPVPEADADESNPPPADSEIPPAGDVSVSIDPITPPGVMAGGSVTFSDGTSGKWYLDQMGRLGLGGVPQGYRPSPEDAALFQSRLVEALQAKGLM